MTIQEWGAVGELIGGIAIIVSLLYVGFQIRQSNRFAKAENVRSLFENTAYMNHDLKLTCQAAADFDSCNLEAKFELHRQMVFLLNRVRMFYEISRLGLVDDAYFQNYLKYLTRHLITPGGWKYWESSKAGIAEPSEIEMIEDYIRDQGEELLPITKLIPWNDLG